MLGRRGGRLAIKRPRTFRSLRIGESVAVDGVCLTVDALEGQAAVFRLLPETLRASTLGGRRAGEAVNLERALRFGDRLGGHLLLGHVDARGRIVGRLRRGRSLTLELRAPAFLRPFLVPKGPIAVDGVSLTLDSAIRPVSAGGAPDLLVRVHLIRYTTTVTTLGEKRIGEEVNLEADPVAKILHRVLS